MHAMDQLPKRVLINQVPCLLNLYLKFLLGVALLVAMKPLYRVFIML
jgi:hypothetical protein